jgi:hypothetical protein
VVLTEGLNGPEERCKLAGDEGRAAGTAALVEEDDAGHLQASGHHGSTRGAPAKVLPGLGGSGDCQRRGNEAAEHFTGPRWKSGHGKGRGRGQKLREASWRRGGAAAGLGRSWGASKRRVHGGAEDRCGGTERGSGARVWGDCGVGDEGAERSRGGLKEGDRNLGDMLGENGQRGSRRAWRGR